MKKGFQTEDRVSRGGPCSGLSMVELMLVMVILVVAILGFVYGLGVNLQGVSVSKHASLALNAARSKVEELKAHSFRSTYADYGPGSGSETFAVTYDEGGRTYTLEGPDGGDAGAIVFCVDETSIPAGFSWVSAYDLNADGDISDTDVSADYRVLPVIARVSWVDNYGPRAVEVKTILFRPRYTY